MAKRLSYEPSAAPTQTTARAEWDALLQALHDSGTLRVLRGLIGSAPQMSDVLLEQLETEGGRNALGNLTIAMTTLTKLEPERVNGLVRALLEGLRAAGRSAHQHPPGLVGLAALLMREDTRRGLHAIVVLLQTIGRELGGADGESRALTPVPASDGASRRAANGAG